ncbi:MAG: BREX system P-loop protein BrxC, partial [Cyanobacteria bacterium CAN_BIN43]|nr:BREX system P-loop protein BrxC [Cyanobacteria bacterium CAN_BIN43]
MPETAEFERTLDRRGEYETFKQAFEQVSNQTWEGCRDGWGFHQDDIVKALQSSTGMSLEAANRLVENHGQGYSLSPEKFALMVKEYVESKGNQHHVLFMVDEVGQYIGNSTDLMLNLQTVVEDLGIHCYGRAWVIVTSQEAIDEITKNRVKGNDFSKIKGRFNRPLSLSSANTDEVIKLRLLRKRDDVVIQQLTRLYENKQAILKNQINFTRDCQDLPGFANAK